MNEDVVKTDSILCNSGSVTRKQAGKKNQLLNFMILKTVFVFQGAPGAYKYQKSSNILYIGFWNEIHDYSIFCSILNT